jgi:hypothetical protein
VEAVVEGDLAALRVVFVDERTGVVDQHLARSAAEVPERAFQALQPSRLALVQEHGHVGLYAGQEMACHAQNAGRRTSIIERSHLVGIVGAHLLGVSWLARPNAAAAPTPSAPAELLRPLAEYETALGGSW